MTADLLKEYSFPIHIVQTDLRTDVVLWDDSSKFFMLMELTIPFETGFEAVQKRKENRSLDILKDGKKAGYTSSIITLDMGSRGLPHMQGFKKLQHQLQISKKDIHSSVKCQLMDYVFGGRVL